MRACMRVCVCSFFLGNSFLGGWGVGVCYIFRSAFKSTNHCAYFEDYCLQQCGSLFNNHLFPSWFLFTGTGYVHVNWKVLQQNENTAKTYTILGKYLVWHIMCVCMHHGSPVSAISHSLVDRLTPIALSLTPGHAWHSSVASGTSGNWAFFVITCACRSCSILWQFQSHAVAKPGFLTAWILVCLLVQSLLFWSQLFIFVIQSCKLW